MQKGAAWLSLLEEGNFPMENDRDFVPNAHTVPIPNETLRQTVSRRDVAGFYFIGESWAMAISDVLEMQHARKELPEEPLVLDIGCGVGKTARFLAMNKKLRYVGFDIFLPAIVWCRKAFGPLVGDRFRFEHFDGVSEFYNPSGRVEIQDYEFPVADWSVDLAFAASLFTHLTEENCKTYLRKSARKLAPTGMALFSIKELPKESKENYAGTEQSMAVRREYFIALAEREGFSFFSDYGAICGQRALVFRVTKS